MLLPDKLLASPWTKTTASMPPLIDWLNQHGTGATSYALQVLWQSSLLIALLAAADWLIRNRARATVRYALWMLLPVKLLLPPALMVPGSAASWFPKPAPALPVFTTSVDVREESTAPTPSPLPPVAPPSQPMRMAPSGRSWATMGWVAVSLVLLGRVMVRAGAVRKLSMSSCGASAEVGALLTTCRAQLGIRGDVEARFCAGGGSPALCGLFRPAILIPRGLAEQLSREQLRAIILHELAHLKRWDLEVNLAQILLQVVFWWHPLLWAANSHIRRLREQAVDEVVAVETAPDESTYAETLLAVARFATTRLPLSPGFLGIIEPSTLMRKRVERLLTQSRPATHRLGRFNAVLLALVALLVLPMARGEKNRNTQERPPGLNAPNYIDAPFQVRFFLLRTNDDLAAWGFRPSPRYMNSHFVWVMTPTDSRLAFDKIGQVPDLQASHPDENAKFLGGRFEYHTVADQPSHTVYKTRTERGRTVVTGADIDLRVEAASWHPGSVEFVATQCTKGATNTFEIDWQPKGGHRLQTTLDVPEGGSVAIMDGTVFQYEGHRGARPIVVLSTSKHPLMSRELAAGAPTPAAGENAKPPLTDGATVSSNLFTRTYKVVPEEFLSTIRDYRFVRGKGIFQPVANDGSAGTIGPIAFLPALDSRSTEMDLVRRYFAESGFNDPFITTPAVGQNSSSPPKDGAALFYNHKTGQLFVRASEGGLDRFEKALGQLQLGSRRVAVNGTFIEADGEWLRQLISGEGMPASSPDIQAWLVSEEEIDRIAKRAESSTGARELIRHNLWLAYGKAGRLADVPSRLAVPADDTTSKSSPADGSGVVSSAVHSVNAVGYVNQADGTSVMKFLPGGPESSLSATCIRTEFGHDLRATVKIVQPRENQDKASPLAFAADFRTEIPLGKGLILAPKKPKLNDHLVLITVTTRSAEAK